MLLICHLTLWISSNAAAINHKAFNQFKMFLYSIALSSGWVGIMCFSKFDLVEPLIFVHILYYFPWLPSYMHAYFKHISLSSSRTKWLIECNLFSDEAKTGIFFLAHDYVRETSQKELLIYMISYLMILNCNTFFRYWTSYTD